MRAYVGSRNRSFSAPLTNAPRTHALRVIWSFSCTFSPMFRKKARHLQTGKQGERAALLYLLLHGYRIVKRNYLCPLGEIDIVAVKRRVIVFVEVRTRQAGALVDPVTSITDRKLANIVDAARYFITAQKKTCSRCRFDIISVRSSGSIRDRIRHYKDVFWITDQRPSRGVRLKRWIQRQPRPGKKTFLRNETPRLSSGQAGKRGNGESGKKP